MKKIYLIRHCKTGTAGSGRCISQTDFSLSEAGAEQAESLKKWAAAKEAVCVYTSPLKRCMETAAYVSNGSEIKILDDLTELSVGEWEGLLFSEIQERWPGEYKQRGREIGTTAPPGGESFLQAGERLEKVLFMILDQTEDTPLIVTHAGILRGWLCKTAKVSMNSVFAFRIPCGSVTEIHWDGTEFVIDSIGMKPVPIPGKREIEEFYEECNTPANVRRHCMAVAKKAAELAQGTEADVALLNAAALLHDLCRADGREHPFLAEKKLKKEGYERLAHIVAVHHNLPDDSESLRRQKIETEAEILYLADKLIQGTSEVSLKERFARSKQKCREEAARQAWQKRFDTSCRLESKYGGKS